MARQHKGEVMIAGEQLRYEGREGEMWHAYGQAYRRFKFEG